MRPLVGARSQRLLRAAWLLELQTARLHNRADKKKALEAKRLAKACLAKRNDAKEELRRATLRLASWETWWSSLSDGEKKKVQKVTRRPPKVCSRYIRKCPKHTNKGNGTRFLIRLPDAAHSAYTRRSMRNTPINAVERGS